MGTIQSSVGLVTGVAIEDTVNQLMALNAIPRDRLEARNALLEQEQVAVTELMTLVVGVQLTTDRLGQSSLFSATSVSSSNAGALSARSTGSPSPGSYSFIPVRQAQSQQLTSALFASSDQKLGDGEVVIHTGGFLDESVDLDTLNGGAGVSRGLVRVTDRSGTSATIDLRFAQNASDVVEAINAADDLGVVASLEDDRFVLTDVTGANAANLQVDEVSGGTTAADLGLGGISTASSTAAGNSVHSLSTATSLRSLRDGQGLSFSTSGADLQFDLQDGTTFNYNSELTSNTASLGELLDEINTAGAGKVEARIASDGKSIEIADLTSGASTFAISSASGDLAEQLGLDNASAGGVVSGNRLVSGLNDTLLDSLNGGSGLGSLGSISITDRSGVSDTVDLSGAETLQDVIDLINGSSAGVSAALNRTKTGIELTDNTGSTSNQLVIANGDGTNSATALQIEASVDASTVDSGSLNRAFITRNTLLSEFNQGQGITNGSIQFTDTTGASATLNLASLAPDTVGEVVDAINNLGLGIEAKLNETGDGLLLVDNAGGAGELTVEDSNGGTAATQLGIAGTGGSLTVGGSGVTGIDGSRTIRVATTSETSVADLASALNELDVAPVSANVLNLGNTGVRLLLNSNSTGSRGRVAIDSDVGISFSETAQGRDALLAFGANESTGGVLVASSDNNFAGLVEDVEFTIESVSETPVTVTISENDDSISDQIDAFVQQYNRMRDKLDELTAFDEITQSVGILFGKGTALRTDLSFGRLLTGSFRGVGNIGSLGQLGVRLNEQGKLDFDKSKFEEAYKADPAAVQEFFTKEDFGFSAKAKAVADGLAGVDTGALLNRSNTLSAQIEQNVERVDALNLRLDRQRDRLLRQFYNMETTIARLQQNLTALNQLQTVPAFTGSLG